MAYLELSSNTVRAMALPRPRLRGLSHRVAAFIAPVVFTLLAIAAPSGTPTTAMIIYGLATWSMFAVSAVVHLRPWPAERMELLFRADHTAIYVMIGGSAIAMAMTLLDGTPRTWLLSLTIGAAVVGIVVEWLAFATPEGVGNTIYLTMSWIIVVFLPAMYRHVGLTPLLLLLAGGVCYTVGAVIVGLRRPDPDPLVFGYHEIWHLLVIAAVGFHTAMLISLW